MLGGQVKALFSVAGIQEKAMARGEGNRRPCTPRVLVTRKSGRYPCRACKQTNAEERRVWGGRETRPQASIEVVGTRGPGIKSFLGGWRFPACSKPAREAAAVRQRELSGQVPGDLPGAGPGGRARGRGPGCLNKAGARAGPAYSQQEAHVGRGLGCGLGGRGASGRQWLGLESKEEEKRRRRGAPTARRPQLVWLR